MNVFHLDPDGHARVQSLLPWYVTSRLEEGERREVEAHLAGCARCRAELALEHQLHASQSEPSEESPGAIERGWMRLRRRIEGQATSARRPAPSVHRSWPWWAWVVGAQFAVITLLVAVLVVPRFETAPYRGLGNGSAGAAANALVMFDPGATEAQIRQALQNSGAHLVGGPTATHAYLLELPQADSAALARLRGEPGVTLAESLVAGEAQ